MERDAVAFCPGHISAWFKPLFTEDREPSGSTGGGIVIDKGVESTAVSSEITEVECLYTGRDGEVIKSVKGSAPVEYALKSAGICAGITTRTDLPPESGFGLSAAAIISSLAAGAKAAGIEIPADTILDIAYRTEVGFRSGLGDVPAVVGGGYVCRREPGLKGDIARRYDMKRPIFVLNFGPLPTSGFLGDRSAVEKVNCAYSKRCPGSPEEFFSIAREFTIRSGLVTPQAGEVLSACDSEGIPASMTMLGNGIFAYGEEALPVLGEFGNPVEVHMADKGFSGDGFR